MEVKYYITDDGRNPVKEWHDSLRDRTTRAKIDAKIARLRLGNLSGTKTVGDGVHELILDFGPGYRIYFAPQGKEIVILLCAGTKKRQQHDIERARDHWANFKKRTESKGKGKGKEK
jgi:putative addiction module killer protein